MTRPTISVNISAPGLPNHIAPDSPVSASSKLSTTLADDLLCPRYADRDASSAPPSPASIESFDVLLDSTAWRRGEISLGGSGSAFSSSNNLLGACSCLPWSRRARQQRQHRRPPPQQGVIFFFLILLALMLLACAALAGGTLAMRHETRRTRAECYRRSGGGSGSGSGNDGDSRCDDSAWAKCVAVNGIGYCEGIGIAG
ncbi:hypothetical protein BU24DRAFT_457971 [Aaosphaeria arxii CBS 175.79]|uniref:Uncharacterized protein n=1 Tax=Aaosphaeria arxii CBS 175.79 TaxID=1450172 RepID=A0A6A5YBT5_9PLEO|nr:uncharacterized protein BU24DRAFT_457971 [Aaosphaeria arxii CBS 175.79]KAF2022074.1 hypothetical protein BU24DRAFT_457971 [Aaosphaeria arxii CBS 175.79]